MIIIYCFIRYKLPRIGFKIGDYTTVLHCINK